MASGSGVVQWEAEPSGDGAVTEEGVKKRALALESQGSFPHLSQRLLSCVGGRLPAGLGELITTGKGATAQLSSWVLLCPWGPVFQCPSLAQVSYCRPEKVCELVQQSELSEIVAPLDPQWT